MNCTTALSNSPIRANLARNLRLEWTATISRDGFQCKAATPVCDSHSCPKGAATELNTISWNDGHSMIAGGAVPGGGVLPRANWR